MLGEGRERETEKGREREEIESLSLSLSLLSGVENLNLESQNSGIRVNRKRNWKRLSLRRKETREGRQLSVPGFQPEYR